jgi:hypothetical protein
MNPVQPQDAETLRDRIAEFQMAYAHRLDDLVGCAQGFAKRSRRRMNN